MDADGKAQSWKYFVRNRKKVRDYLESMVSNREDAADLLQDIGMIICRHDAAPLEAERFVSWCMGIARNIVLHHWRRARRHDRVFTASDGAGGEWSLALSFEGALLDREHIAACLRGLDEPSRRLLLLRYVMGKTSREIAEDLGQSPAAVRMKIMRVCATLRERIRKTQLTDSASPAGVVGGSSEPTQIPGTLSLQRAAATNSGRNFTRYNAPVARRRMGRASVPDD